MRSLPSRSCAIAAVAVLAMVGTSGMAFVAAGRSAAAQSWTQISPNTGSGGGSAGLLRTADGRLHVVWASRVGTTTRYSLLYATLGAKLTPLNTGAIVNNWRSVSSYPRLVPRTSGGIRVIFSGGSGQSGSPFSMRGMYSATAGKAGQTWTLTPGSMAHAKSVPLSDDAAAVEANGTPVAGWSSASEPAFDFHVGLDPTSPATGLDQSVSAGTSGVVAGPTMVRDKTGNIWAAWFHGSGTASQGYYVDRILPTPVAVLKAPNSGGANVKDNSPGESVALATRVGGGVYLAYCVPTSTLACGHINLWKTGATTALTVPGSTTGHASHVAIAAAPGGYLWIAWYVGMNKIRVVRTNASVSGFGTARTISGPPGTTANFFGLQAEASLGPLDLIANVAQGRDPIVAYWATELP